MCIGLSRSRVKVENTVFETFEINNGILQGDELSLLMLILLKKAVSAVKAQRNHQQNRIYVCFNLKRFCKILICQNLQKFVICNYNCLKFLMCFYWRVVGFHFSFLCMYFSTLDFIRTENKFMLQDYNRRISFHFVAFKWYKRISWF